MVVKQQVPNDKWEHLGILERAYARDFAKVILCSEDDALRCVDRLREMGWKPARIPEVD